MVSVHELVSALPQWVLVGLAVGAVASVFVAVLFAVADRLFPTSYDPRTRTGENRRREELREYLRAIDEPFTEDHPVAGRPVAFYLPERDVAITFDARTYYRIEHTETHAVLVEHEMPGVQLGDRLPFQTPGVDVGQPTVREDPTSAAFAELGLPTTAGKTEIKRAYRQRIKEVHPDQGGDEESFRRVREAYTTAKKHIEDATSR